MEKYMIIGSAFKFMAQEDGAIGIVVYLDDKPTADASRLQYMLFWPCGYWGCDGEKIAITQQEDNREIIF
jgi:hypothetical protein